MTIVLLEDISVDVKCTLMYNDRYEMLSEIHYLQSRAINERLMVISYSLWNNYLALWIEEYQYCKMSVDHLKSVSPIRDHRAAALSWTADQVISEIDIQYQYS